MNRFYFEDLEEPWIWYPNHGRSPLFKRYQIRVQYPRQLLCSVCYRADEGCTSELCLVYRTCKVECLLNPAFPCYFCQRCDREIEDCIKRRARYLVSY